MWCPIQPSFSNKWVFDEVLGIFVYEHNYGSRPTFRAQVAGEDGLATYPTLDEAKKNALRLALNRFGPVIERAKKELTRLEKPKCGECHRPLSESKG